MSPPRSVTASVAETEVQIWTARPDDSAPPRRRRVPSRGRVPSPPNRAPPASFPSSPPKAPPSTPAFASGIRDRVASGSPDCRGLAASTSPRAVSKYSARSPTATWSTCEPPTDSGPSRCSRTHGKMHTTTSPVTVAAAHRPCPAPTLRMASVSTPTAASTGDGLASSSPPTPAPLSLAPDSPALPSPSSLTSLSFAL
eukprot:6172908-Pleurochrysis_carterae.AAC.2